jgi:VCBS repeat protein/IPT/TIG domain-containing protein
MRHTPRASLTCLAVFALFLSLAPAHGEEFFGPPIGSKSKYSSNILGLQEPDTDDYVGRFVEGEFLNVTVSAVQRSSLLPSIELLRPDGSSPQIVTSKSRSDRTIKLKKFPIDQSGGWAVRVSGDADTQGEYTVSFAVKKAKPIKLKKQVLPVAAKEEATHLFGGIEGALLNLKLTFDNKRGAVALDALKDPGGDDVPGLGGPLAGEATVKGSKVQIKKAPLAAGDGNYAAMVSTADGSTAKYNLTIKVVPQGRLNKKGTIELSPLEPVVARPTITIRAAPGVQVDVAGSNFQPTSQVFIGANEAEVLNVAQSGTTLRCIVPPGDDGETEALTVVNPDGQASTRADYIFYAPPPVVSAITTTTGVPVVGGSTVGGLQIRIDGANLASQNLVDFGGVPAAALQAQGSSRLLVTTPLHASQNTFVRVVDEFGRSAVNRPDFEFKVPPRFSAAPYSPGVIRPEEQAVVTVTGSNFSDDDVLLFNGVVIASTLPSPAQRQFTIAPTPEGPQTVQLRDRVGTVVDGPTLQVKGPPILTTIVVVSGSEAGDGEIPLLGGTNLRVIGRNFAAEDVVTLGGTVVMTTSVLNTQFDFVAPAHLAGLVDLVVTDADGLDSSLRDALRYVGYVDVTAARSPGRSTTDDLSALAGAVGDLDGDGDDDDVAITSPNGYFENFYPGGYGYRYLVDNSKSNSPGSRSEYTRILFGDSSGDLVDETEANFPAAGSDDFNGTAIAVGDLDGVTGDEIVLGGIRPDYGYYYDVRLFLNDGSGSFSEAPDDVPTSRFEPYYYVYYVYYGYVYQYNTFPAAGPRYILGIPTAIGLGDLDGDNDLDVVVARDSHDQRYVYIDPDYIYSYDGYLVFDYYYLYYGNIYINAYVYDSALRVLDNAISDGDGLVDVTDDRLPGLSASTPAFVGRDVAIGDIDGINGPDIIVTWDDPTTVTPYDINYGGGSAIIATRVLINDGYGYFDDYTSTWMPSGASPEFFQAHQVELGDLDGDGDLDMVLVHEDGLASDHSVHALRVLRNDSEAAFTNVTATAIPPISSDDFRGGALTLGDVNGDGDLDILVGTTEGLLAGADVARRTRLFLGNGDLTFKSSTAFNEDPETDSGEANALLLIGDLAGLSDPALVLLSETAPTNPGGSSPEMLRIREWRKDAEEE